MVLANCALMIDSRDEMIKVVAEKDGNTSTTVTSPRNHKVNKWILEWQNGACNAQTSNSGCIKCNIDFDLVTFGIIPGDVSKCPKSEILISANK